MKTIKRHKLNPITMSVNNTIPTIVIDNNIVKEYVGIGWINIRTATKKDILTIHKVID